MRNETIRRRRGSNRCIRITAAFCMVHVFRHFFLFFSYTDNYLKSIQYPDEFSPPRMMMSPERKLSTQIDDKRLGRKRRTTPLPKLQDLGVQDATSTDTNGLVRIVTMDSTFPSYPMNKYVEGDEICGRDETNGYGTNDRIVIAGILSHPVAAELALKLARGCGVRHILGISNHLQTTEESSRLEFLLNQIPSLQIQLGRGALGSRATDELFESFSPSHVFYFRQDFDEEDPLVFRSTLDQLEQICNAIVKMKFKLPTKKSGTRLLYVASDLPEASKSNLSATFASMILGTYRAKYHLDARVLHLPYIFGPFTEGSSWLRSDNFIHRVNEIVGGDRKRYDKVTPSKVKTANSFDISRPVMSITDAIRSILVSGKPGDTPNYDSIPILSAQKFQTTLSNLIETLLPLLTTALTPTINNKLSDGSLLPILSWNYKRTKPYRDPAEFYISPIDNNKMVMLGLNKTRDQIVEAATSEVEAFSQLERRQHNLFPCISVCASLVECKSSVWESIAPVVKEITEGCKFLLYTANFSRNPDALPEVIESVNKGAWPRGSFCQLAFVSSTSTIVNHAIQEELKNSGDEASKNKTADEWNGKVSINGWTLLWVEADEESLDQADLMIPKTNPESILSPNVETAFYIEPQHYRIVPPLQLWFEMSKHMVSPADPRRSLPERRIGFFAHAYNESAIGHLDMTKFDYIPKAAEVVLEQKKKGGSDDVRNFKTTRQSEAYSTSLMWQKEEFEFELIDTALVMFQIHDTRARQLRCEWYEEQLFWSNEQNRNLEGLSLSFVLNRWRRRGRLLRNTIEEKWGDMILLGENGEELSPAVAEFERFQSLKGEDFSPTEVQSTKIAPQPDPEHYLKILASIKVRNVYTSE